MTMQMTYSGYECAEEVAATCPFCNGDNTEFVKDLQPEEAELWVCHDCEVGFKVEYEIPW
jgi:uncharacterized protein YbaR (Trm112 family)